MQKIIDELFNFLYGSNAVKFYGSDEEDEEEEDEEEPDEDDF